MNLSRCYWCIVYFAVILCSSILSDFVVGSPDTTVEFNNRSLPLTMSTDKYFKDLASEENAHHHDALDDDYSTLEHGKRRTKRFITFNVAAPIDLGFLISIPITLILPSMANLFNKRVGRSIPREVDPDIFEDQPYVQPHLDRVAGYFELLQIPERACQQRAVCEFSATPEKYYPVSEMVLNRIRNPDLPLPDNYDEDVQDIKNTKTGKTKSKKSLFTVYNKAADKGMISGDNACHSEFHSKCPYSIEKRLNMPVLKFWRALSTLLKFTIKDTM